MIAKTLITAHWEKIVLNFYVMVQLSAINLDIKKYDDFSISKFAVSLNSFIFGYNCLFMLWECILSVWGHYFIILTQYYLSAGPI